MSITQSEYINVAAKVTELGLSAPTGIALLPRNLAEVTSASDLVHAGTAATVRKLWREVGITETRLEPAGSKFSVAEEKALTWIGPAIFVTLSYLSENPNVLSVALGVISNYLTDFFRGAAGRPQAELKIIAETSAARTYRLFEYKGDVEGLVALNPAVLEAAKISAVPVQAQPADNHAVVNAGPQVPTLTAKATAPQGPKKKAKKKRKGGKR